MKKRLILHIGCEKTGTTSIQNTLAANRTVLLEKYGIHYLKSLGLRNHTKLAIYACNGDKNLTRFLPNGLSLQEFREDLRQEFIKEIQNTTAETVIISCEWLHPRLRDDSEFSRLKALLSGLFGDVKVIVYLRRQDKLLMSLYSTSLKAGNYKKFSFPNVNSHSSLPYYLDFLSIYQKWKSEFGLGNVQIRVFDRKRLYKGDVVRDFVHEVIGLDDEVFLYYDEDNRSISNRGILVMRGLNFLLHTFRPFIRADVARKRRQQLAKKFVGIPKLARKEECSEFMSWFQSSNHQLEEQYQHDTGRSINL